MAHAGCLIGYGTSLAVAGDITELKYQYWLATSDGRDVGYVLAYLSEGRIWIKKLYLLAETRGQGLGKALINTACKHFGNHLSAAYSVNDGSKNAIAFNRPQGFEVDRHIPVRMGPYDFHDYVMVKE